MKQCRREKNKPASEHQEYFKQNEEGIDNEQVRIMKNSCTIYGVSSASVTGCALTLQNGK